MKKVLLILVVLMLLVAGTGCQDEQKQFGAGDTPDHWQEWFGNKNGARLNYLQQQEIEKLRAVIYGVKSVDDAGNPVHKRGLIERVTALEGQIDKLNSVDDLERRILEVRDMQRDRGNEWVEYDEIMENGGSPEPTQSEENP